MEINEKSISPYLSVPSLSLVNQHGPFHHSFIVVSSSIHGRTHKKTKKKSSFLPFVKLVYIVCVCVFIIWHSSQVVW